MQISTTPDKCVTGRTCFLFGLGLLLSVLCGRPVAAQAPNDIVADKPMGKMADKIADTASICPANPAETVIHVILEMPEPQIDHTKNRENLRDFSVTTKSPYGETNATHVNGVMRGPVELKTNMTIAWQSDPQHQQNCFWYRTITFTLHLQPTIYVATDIPEGTCYYNAIIEHEMKHVEVDRGLVRDYQNILYDTVEAFVRQHGMLDHSPVGEEDKAQKQLMQAVENTIRDVHAHMRDDRIDRQAKIDTLQEYNRVSQQCPSEEFF